MQVLIRLYTGLNRTLIPPFFWRHLAHTQWINGLPEGQLLETFKIFTFNEVFIEQISTSMFFTSILVFLVNIQGLLCLRSGVFLEANTHLVRRRSYLQNQLISHTPYFEIIIVQMHPLISKIMELKKPLIKHQIFLRWQRSLCQNFIQSKNKGRFVGSTETK